MKRIVYRIRPYPHFVRGEKPLWLLTYAEVKRIFDTQKEAIEIAVLSARTVWAGGRRAQVVLHGKSGRVRWERSYGRDPRRTRG
jgi:hypothetical protein